MNCKRYRDWIRDAALDALKLSRRAELDAHLSGCPECARSLKAELELLGAVNRAMGRNAGAQPPAEFAARVHLRLTEEREKAGSNRMPGSRVWIPIGALAAVAALMLVIWIARRPARMVPQQANLAAPPAAVQTAKPPATGQTSATTRPTEPLRAWARSSRREAQGHGGRHASHQDEAPQPQVMVQPGQWAGIVMLYRESQSGRIDTASLAGSAAENQDPQKLAPVEIKPLAISELQPPEPIDSDEANHSHP